MMDLKKTVIDAAKWQIAFVTILAIALAAPAGAANTGTSKYIQKVVSSKGIVAWLNESNHAQTLSMRISFNAGSWYDPATLPGLAYLNAFMFNEGAGDINAEEFSKRMKRIAASIGGAASAEYLTVLFDTPKMHSGEAFELLYLALNRPRTDPDAIERAKQSSISNLRQEEVNPVLRGYLSGNTILYRHAQLARSGWGTDESIKSITAEQVREFRKNAVTRSNVRIAVAGAISAAELAPVLDRLFGDLPETSDFRDLPKPEGAGQQQAAVKMDLPQSVVVMRNLAPLPENEKKRTAAKMVNYILGSEPTGRLFLELREKRGLVYGISSSRRIFQNFGEFAVNFATAAEQADKVLETVRSVLKDFVEKGPTPEEFEEAKSAYTGGFYFTLVGNSNMASQLLDLQQGSMPLTSLDDFTAQVNALTLQDLKDVAKELIRPENMVVVRVGKS